MKHHLPFALFILAMTALGAWLGVVWLDTERPPLSFLHREPAVGFPTWVYGLVLVVVGAAIGIGLYDRYHPNKSQPP